MDKFLHSLDIYIDGDMKGDEYVADIMDSDEYDRILSKLSNNNNVELDEDSSTLTLHNASNVYDSDEYQIIVTADFDSDLYKLTVKELK